MVRITKKEVKKMPQKQFDLRLKLICHPPVQKYYERLMAKATKEIALAQLARKSGVDLESDIETLPALDLADRCESIIGPAGIAKRYREEFVKTNDRIKTIFLLFREMMEQTGWYREADPQKRLDQSIRTALVLVTEGAVVAPLDGVPRILISKNPDGSQYVDIYFAGPIRAAGGTATVFPLILGDFARKLLNLDRYKPTDDEVERYVEETAIYDEIVSRQYKLKEDEVRKIIRNCTVCINGEPTEDREVSVHRDLDRVLSNQVRGGACLVISEGVALKARKIISYAKQLELDWNWLEQIIKVEKSDGSKKGLSVNDNFLERMAAGRPIFSYPLRIGGFRLRYGRGRNTAAMGKAIHPATMYVLDEFIAVGTQLKVERPGKAAEVFPCDSIEGPIVRLFNGTVLQIDSVAMANQYRTQIERILFLGDLLATVGDFRKSGHPLVPVGYCEEWWLCELSKALSEGKKTEVSLEAILKKPKIVSIKQSLQLNSDLGVPLHSNFVYYYKALDSKLFIELYNGLYGARQLQGENGIGLELSNEADVKSAFEKIGVPHSLENDAKTIRIGEQTGLALLKTFGVLDNRTIDPTQITNDNILEVLNLTSGLIIRDKCGTFIGCRMGRPEASHPRKMIGNPHTLFPIGTFGGPTRSINKAAVTNEKSISQKNEIEVEIALFECPECRQISSFPQCGHCRAKTIPRYWCKKCEAPAAPDRCPKCAGKTNRYSLRKIELNEIVSQAAKNVGIKMPPLVKGVRGLINETKEVEPLEKGILRANYDLHVFRDATIRYEMLNAAITHFKPVEIQTPVSRLRELGYEFDMDGKPLETEDQMVELFPQDVIINEEAGDFFVKVAKFLDDELSRLYGVTEYFKKNKRDEMVGELVLGLAPHTSAAVVGRIIGYTKSRLGWGHPYFHLAKRRNIDGDQDSMMLLMDALLNFSNHYLPSSRGGRMDAPLVFTIALTPNEVDDEVYDMDTGTSYPLELYEKAQEFAKAESVSIDIILKRLGKPEQYSGIKFSHSTGRFDEGPHTTRYVQLQSMEDKLNAQIRLQKKIAAVDLKNSLELVLQSHFLPDIVGNIRSFSKQQMRCTKCNAKYRRVPLKGLCTKCGGHIILTIAQGSVRKYLELAKNVVHQNNLSNYLAQRLDLIEDEINSVFKPEKTTQKSLFEFA
ncbi:MAG: DNA polymerase II large subunit [Candidatus Micrarchaeota archaeon]